MTFWIKKFGFVSVNVADLNCKKCEDPIRNLIDLENHLIEKHDEPLPDTDDPVLIPFNIGKGLCICAWCSKRFGEYGALSNHMNVHYPNYKCKICNSGFLTADRLKFHEADHERQRNKKKSKKLNITARDNPVTGQKEITIEINDNRSEVGRNQDTDKDIDQNKSQEITPKKV